MIGMNEIYNNTSNFQDKNAVRYKGAKIIEKIIAASDSYLNFRQFCRNLNYNFF